MAHDTLLSTPLSLPFRETHPTHKRQGVQDPQAPRGSTAPTGELSSPASRSEAVFDSVAREKLPERVKFVHSICNAHLFTYSAIL